MRKFLLVLALSFAGLVPSLRGQTIGGNLLQGSSPACAVLAYQNISYSCAIQAVGGEPPYTFVKSSGSFPAGITMNSAGNLSGTPTASGSTSFGVTVTDQAASSFGFQVTVSVASLSSLTVNAPSNSLSTSGSSTVQATCNAVWSNGVTGKPINDLTATAGWSSSTPSTASVSATGLITAIAAGSTNITCGPFNSVTSPNFAVTVSGSTIVVGSASLCNGQINQPYPESPSPTCPGSQGVGSGVQLSATGGTPPYTWTITSGALQAGLSLSSAGLISGTPTASGSSGTITFQAKDTLNNTGTAALVVTVASLSSIAVTPAAPTINANAQLQMTATATYSDSTTVNVTQGSARNISFVNSASGCIQSGITGCGSSAATTVATAAFNAIVGNTLFVFCGHGTDATTVINTPTDTAGNTFTAIDASQLNDTNLGSARTYVASIVTGNAADVVTCNFAASVGFSVALAVQYAGLSTTVDVHNNTDQGSAKTNTCTGASTTTTNANDLILFSCYPESRSGTTSFSANTPFTLRVSDSAVRGGSEDEVVSTTQSAIVPTMNYSGASKFNLNFVAAIQASSSANGCSWTSSATNVASVNGSGLVTAGSPSTNSTSTIACTIGATSGNTTLTVNAATTTDTSLVVTPNPASGIVGSTVTFQAVGNNSGANLTNSSVWTSSNTAIAHQ